jgi:hypothetical protein
MRPDHCCVEAAAGRYEPPLSTATQRLDRWRTTYGIARPLRHLPVSNRLTGGENTKITTPAQ